jgi:putative ABC transport system permease protein
MLQLKNISKKYVTGELTTRALDDVSLTLRDNEFVAVLGPSGSGKTTLLNIIGGLDRYDEGDMIIGDISTKQYKDRDWDSYRNHTIGFVFQTYNLIPHQKVISNVELALTISGISKNERKRRAREALEKVGLGDQINKKPTQLSGGQMQRVAIARALVNNPDILLADEPTGALDSETSVQVMDLLKEVAKDRLVIMVTHNSELADDYSNRIVKLRDGKITGDSNPVIAGTENEPEAKHQRMGKTSMSFFTALSLSLNNLLTKKARTFLTSFAGSIGIIGIALILSLSTGVQNYIYNIEADTLSTYPLTITGESVDLTSVISGLQGTDESNRTDRDPDQIYSSNIMTDLLKTVSAQVNKNDLKQFKKFLEKDGGDSTNSFVNTIQYGYDLDLQVYSSDVSDGVLKVNPSTLFSQLSGGAMDMSAAGGSSGFGGFDSLASSSPLMTTDVWTEMIGNDELLKKQYDVIAGTWPNDYNEVVLVVDENNELSDAVLYSLGLLDQDELTEMMEQFQKGEEVEPSETRKYTYDELLDHTFKLVLNSDVYEKDGETWADKSDDTPFMKKVVADALELKVVAILRPNPEVTAASIGGSVAYTSDLQQYVIDEVAKAKIVKDQKADSKTNVLTGLPFDIKDFTESLTMEDVNDYILTLPEAQQAQMGAMLQTMSETEVIALFSDMMKDSAGEAATYEDNLTKFGVVDVESPSSINIYPKDFEAKDQIAELIENYNIDQKAADHDEYVISYTDVTALLMSSVTTIIDMISYVLIGFVSISLIVSSIMIAIITYISVLERTKEIGILRSIGASKGDISRVFNAETIIEGLLAGVVGIVVTLLANIPINAVIQNWAGVSNLSQLPWVAALALVALSVVLTVIAGFIPSRIAAKKDPVVALRSE